MDKWTFGKEVISDSQNDNIGVSKSVAKMVYDEIKKLSHHRCHACDGYGHVISKCPTNRKFNNITGDQKLQKDYVKLTLEECKKKVHTKKGVEYSNLSSSSSTLGGKGVYLLDVGTNVSAMQH